jgi:hypothetical protein
MDIESKLLKGQNLVLPIILRTGDKILAGIFKVNTQNKTVKLFTGQGLRNLKKVEQEEKDHKILQLKKNEVINDESNFITYYFDDISDVISPVNPTYILFDGFPNSVY